MSGDGMEDDYLYDGRTRMIKCEVSKCNHNCIDVCYYKDTYSANNCHHCKGLGCEYCEDVTLPLHNKKAMQEALDFCKRR